MIDLIKKLWKEYYLVLMLFGSAIILAAPKIYQLLGFGVIEENNTFVDALFSISNSILASGVFAAIAKSALFREIFIEAIEDVFYKEEHLQKQSQSELKYIWQRLSKVIYNNKFPQISNKIQEYILKTYFPSEHKFYYANFTYMFKIEKHKEYKNYIEVTEEFDLNANDIEENSVYELSSSVYTKKEEQNLCSCDVEYLSFNGESYLNDFDKTSNAELFDSFYQIINNKGKVNFPQGISNCKIKVKIRRVYSLINLNKIKAVNFERFVDGLRVIIHYPKDEYEIDFSSLGSLGDFTDKGNSEIGFIYKEYNDIIFPNQGFLIYIDKKEDI